MKIMFLANVSALALEAEVNEFIKDKDVVDIKYCSLSLVTEYTSNGTPKDTTLVDRVLIMYNEKSKEGEIDEKG